MFKEVTLFSWYKCQNLHRNLGDRRCIKNFTKVWNVSYHYLSPTINGKNIEVKKLIGTSSAIKPLHPLPIFFSSNVYLSHSSSNNNTKDDGTVCVCCYPVHLMMCNRACSIEHVYECTSKSPFRSFISSLSLSSWLPASPLLV